MENRINVAELLKDCPKGMELDCTMFDDVTLEECTSDYIYIRLNNGELFGLSIYGNCLEFPISKCVIFPKGKTTWEGFVPPCKFKDGDIVYTNKGSIAIIYHKEGFNPECLSFCGLFHNKFDKDVVVIPKRLATEEEKEKLFDAIKANGYKWNAETRTLEKLNRFNAGDVLVSSLGNIVLVSHIDNKQIVYYHCILNLTQTLKIVETPDCGVGRASNCTLATDKQRDRLFDRLKNNGYTYNSQTNKLEKLIVPKFKVGDKIRLKNKPNGIICIVTKTNKDGSLNVNDYSWVVKYELQDNYELVPNKFDITTLKPFDKVLIRSENSDIWE